MAKSKRFYWLKMQEGFFKDLRMKKLRKIAGGDTYTIIYLKLMLGSLEKEGIITYQGIEDSLAEEIALDLDEDPDNVEVTIQFLLKSGLMEQISDCEYYLPEVVNNLDSECESAKRVRDCRARKAQFESLQCNNDVTETLQCNNDVTECNEDVIDCNTEIEKDIDKDIDIDTPPPIKRYYSFGLKQHVMLTQEEVKELQTNYGMEKTYLAITRLDNYMHTTGKDYPDHFETLKNWIEEDLAKKATGT